MTKKQTEEKSFWDKMTKDFDRELKRTYDRGFLDGWNACIDKIPEKMDRKGLYEIEYD